MILLTNQTHTHIVDTKQHSTVNHGIMTDRPEWGGTPWTLCPSHLKQCSYSSQSHFQTQGLSRGEKNKNKNKAAKYMRGSVPKQMNKRVCQTLWRWPFCLSIRVAYFYLLLWAFLLLNYSSDFFSTMELKENPSLQVYAHEILMTKGVCMSVCVHVKELYMYTFIL